MSTVVLDPASEAATGDGRPPEPRASDGRSVAQKRAVAAVIALLVVLALAAHVARDALSVRPDIESDQLNIATISLKRHQPGVFERDYTFGGSSDPSRFYTPWQVDLVWRLWQLTGSPKDAFLIQLPLMFLFSVAAVGGATYWLTRSPLIALLMVVVATPYRSVPFGSEIWGLGPLLSVVPRAWAGPIVIVALTFWLRAVQRHDGRFLVLAVFLLGALVNIHPPTGVPATGMLLLAALLEQLGWHTRDRRGWGWWVAACVAAGLGAAPFLLHYLSSATVTLQTDYDAYLAAVRYRLDEFIWPELGIRYGRWVSVAPDETFTKLLPLATALAGGAVLAIHRSTRPYLRALVLFLVSLVFVSMFLPAAGQVALIELRLSPVPPTEIMRGARLVMLVPLMLGILATASLLRGGPLAQLGAVILATMLLGSAFEYGFRLQFPRSDPWSLLGMALAVGLVVAMIGLIAAHRRRSSGSVALGATASMIVLMLVFPLTLLVARGVSTGRSPFVPPPPEPVAVASEELLAWVRSLPEDVLIDTTGIHYRLAMRVRLEAERATTLNLKDGGVLVYGASDKAIDWHQRMIRRDAILATADLDGLRAAAAELGAPIVLVDRATWKAALPGGKPPPIQLNIRWHDDVTTEMRVALEREYQLTERGPSEGRTWRYLLHDPAIETVATIVKDPRVVDTSGVNRETFRPTGSEQAAAAPVVTVPPIWHNEAFVAFSCCP